MRRTQGFTLFELLIVVGLLVVIAGVTVPQYFYATAESQERALVTDLEAVREAIQQYRDDHGGTWPGRTAGAASETTFVRHLTRRSDERGNPDSAGAFGPYLSAGIPPNPFNGKDTVEVIQGGAMPDPNGMTGWLYHSDTGRFQANSPGEVPSGEKISDL